MSIFFKLWGLLALTLVIISCKEIKKIELEKTDSLEFILPDDVGFDLFGLQYYSTPNKFILFSNRRDKIWKYNINTRNYEELYLNYKPTAYTFYENNYYIYKEYEKGLYIYDSKLKLLSNYNYNNIKIENNKYDLRGNINYEIMISNNDLVFYAGIEAENSIDYSKAKTLAKINMDNFNLSIFGSNPNINSNGAYIYYYVATRNKNVYVTSENMNKVDIYDLQTMELRDSKLLPKSQYLTKINYRNADSINNDEYNLKFEYENGVYLFLYYDKYTDLFFRMVRHGLKSYKDYYSISDYSKSDWSLQIFDSEFRLIDEKYFSADEYYYRNLVFTENGILISKMTSKFLEKYKSNKIKFDLFKIKVY